MSREEKKSQYKGPNNVRRIDSANRRLTSRKKFNTLRRTGTISTRKTSEFEFENEILPKEQTTRIGHKSKCPVPYDPSQFHYTPDKYQLHT